MGDVIDVNVDRFEDGVLKGTLVFDFEDGVFDEAEFSFNGELIVVYYCLGGWYFSAPLSSEDLGIAAYHELFDELTFFFEEAQKEKLLWN